MYLYNYISMYLHIYITTNLYISLYLVIYKTIYLYVYVPMYLCTYISMHLYICVSIYLSIYLIMYIYIYVYILYIYMSICLVKLANPVLLTHKHGQPTVVGFASSRSVQLPKCDPRRVWYRPLGRNSTNYNYRLNYVLKCISICM